MPKTTVLFLLTLLAALIQALSWPCAVRAERVLVWQNDKAVIYGSLPDSWRPMAAEELEAFSSAGKELLPGGNGDFVSGFRLHKEKKPADAPFILAFINREERVSREQMQKTYSWFEKNNRLVSGVLPAQVKGMSIENIEYLQDRFTIIFQIGLALEKGALNGMSGIVFLQNGYLTVIGFAGEKDFAAHKKTFYSFISTLSVPPSMQYDFNAPGFKPDLGHEVFNWIINNWQQISGALLLLGVYAIVFRRGKRKFGEEGG